MPLWSKLFLLLSCGGFVALVEVSSERHYRVVRLLLGGVGCYAHGLGLTSEGQRGTLTEEEGDRVRLTRPRELRSTLPTWDRKVMNSRESHPGDGHGDRDGGPLYLAAPNNARLILVFWLPENSDITILDSGIKTLLP
jgi:hypothetical protein